MQLLMYSQQQWRHFGCLGGGCSKAMETVVFGSWMAETMGVSVACAPAKTIIVMAHGCSLAVETEGVSAVWPKLMETNVVARCSSASVDTIVSWSILWLLSSKAINCDGPWSFNRNGDNGSI